MAEPKKSIKIVLINHNGATPEKPLEMTIIRLPLVPCEQRSEKGTLLLVYQPAILVVDSPNDVPTLFGCYHIQGPMAELLIPAEHWSSCTGKKTIIDVGHWNGFLGLAPDDATLIHLLKSVAEYIKGNMIRDLYHVPQTQFLDQRIPPEYFASFMQWSMNMGVAGFPIPEFNS